MTAIKDILRETAQELASGAEAAVVHVHAAADALIRDIMRERDALIAALNGGKRLQVGDVVKAGSVKGKVVGFDASGVVMEGKGADGKPLQSSVPAHLVQPAAQAAASVPDDPKPALVAAAEPSAAPANGDGA